MSQDQLRIAQLKQRFSKVDCFTTSDLRKFYTSPKFVISDEAFRSRIHRLSKSGVLRRIGHGNYCLGEQAIFIPTINKNVEKLYKTIYNQYPYAKVSIWHTLVLNEFMIHQPFKFNFIIEVEKDATESVFYFLKDKFRSVYLNPTKEIYEKYISGTTDSIIVKNLISESPINDIDGVMTPTIEKILVDIFCDKTIYTAFQGNEMQNIFENVFGKYTVNISTLLRYALRRGKKEEIDTYIKRLKLKKH